MDGYPRRTSPEANAQSDSVVHMRASSPGTPTTAVTRGLSGAFAGERGEACDSRNTKLPELTFHAVLGDGASEEELTLA
jgi:hypothetical protein